VTQAIAYYRSLPRAARWSFWALAGLLAYFAMVEPLVNLYASMNRRAKDQSSLLVGFERSRRKADDAQASVATGVARFGEVAPPGDPDARPDAFSRKVAAVLTTHGIKDQKTTTRSSALGKGPLLESLGQGAQVMRYAIEVQFDGTPEQVAAIIADLEKTPEVAAVTKLQIRRLDEDHSRTVHATISAETWLLSRKSGKGAA
jgi:hypothetical protein